MWEEADIGFYTSVASKNAGDTSLKMALEFLHPPVTDGLSRSWLISLVVVWFFWLLIARVRRERVRHEDSVVAGYR